MDEKDKSLEYWIAKATDPTSDSAADFFENFAARVNEELEGPQVACRLLAHKLQSPNEVEALHAFSLLQHCVDNCGHRFHNEIGTFRFLNEIIKILSPKFMGNESSSNVKQRAIENLYVWKQSFRHLPKFKQAYDMLCEQKIIKNHPTYMDKVIGQPEQPPPPRRAPFEDRERSQLLDKLLKSKNPEDLQAANRLIKSLVKSEDEKVERKAKRDYDLQEATNNAQLLNEMMQHFNELSVTKQDADIMKQLYDVLVKLRPTLFRYASEVAESNEEILSLVLSANDEVNRIIELFRIRVEPHIKHLAQYQTLIEAPPAPDLNTLISLENRNIDPSVSDERSYEADSIMLTDNVEDTKNILEMNPTLNSTSDIVITQEKLRLSSLDHLSQELIDQNLPSGVQSHTKLEWVRRQVPLKDLGIGSDSDNQIATIDKPNNGSSDVGQIQPIDDIELELTQILPGNRPPIVILDREKIRIEAHQAGNILRSDIVCILFNTTSKYPCPLKSIKLDVWSRDAIVKMQSASSNHLPPFNPLIPQGAISQIALIAHKQSTKICLEFSITYKLEDEPISNSISASFEILLGET